MITLVIVLFMVISFGLGIEFEKRRSVVRNARFGSTLLMDVYCNVQGEESREEFQRAIKRLEKQMEQKLHEIEGGAE